MSNPFSKTMIYYFHYTNKGSHPFAKDWMSEENIAMAELNEEQASFLVETAHEIMRRSKRSYELPLNDVARTDQYHRVRI